MVDIWENLVKTKKVRVLIYLDKYLNRINKCMPELQNQCIGGMLC